MSFPTLGDRERDELHRQLREYYEKNGMDKPVELGPLSGETVYPSAQAALDASLARARQGEARQINLRNYTGSMIIPSLQEEKAAPPGVHILPQGQRVGDVLRDEYVNRLGEAFSRGYIDQGEFAARKDAVMIAATKDELDFLVRDLPAEKKVPAVPPAPAGTRRLLLACLMNIIAVTFPVMAAITILAGGHDTAATVLALIGGAAALVLSFVLPKMS